MKVVVHLSLDTTAGMIYTQQCPHNHTLHTSSTQQQAWSSHHYTQSSWSYPPYVVYTTAGVIRHYTKDNTEARYIPLMKCPHNLTPNTTERRVTFLWWNVLMCSLLDCDDKTITSEHIGMIVPIAKVSPPLCSHAIDLAVPARSTEAVSSYLWTLLACVKVSQMTAVTQLTLVIELKRKIVIFSGSDRSSLRYHVPVGKSSKQ